MIRMISLNQDSARAIATTRASRHLRDQLKRSFRRSEIRQRQTRIDRNHADQSHVRKVVTLREHLRADQRIDPSGAEVSQRLFKDFSPRGRVAIDSRDAQSREEQLQHLFELFRAFANVVDVFLSARRTHARHRFAMIAVMTNDHALAAMISERHVAVRTLNRFTARAAENETRITTPVEQDDRLLSALVRFANRFEQFI